MVVASVVIERLEVALLGEAGPPSAHSDACAAQSSAAPAADVVPTALMALPAPSSEQGETALAVQPSGGAHPALWSDRICVAVLDRVDAIHAAFYLVEVSATAAETTASSDSSSSGSGGGDSGSGGGGGGGGSGQCARQPPAMYLTVTLPDALCLRVSDTAIPVDTLEPPLVSVTLRGVRASLSMGPDAMDIQAKVGAGRIECAGPAKAVATPESWPAGLMAPSQPGRRRTLCLLETLASDGASDWLSASIRIVEPTSALLSDAAARPEAMIAIDGLVGHIVLHASHGLVDHVVTRTIAIGTSLVQRLPPSLVPKDEPPPPPEPPPDPLPPLPPMMLRLEIPKISAHIYEVGASKTPQVEVSSSGLGGYDEGEVVCSLELRAAAMEIMVRASRDARAASPVAQRFRGWCPPRPMRFLTLDAAR